MKAEQQLVSSPTRENILAAAAALAAGKLVAMPTETVYGLAGDACDERAIATIFEAKNRPRFNPLIVHFADAARASEAGQFDSIAHQLAERFWPGPLTLVLRRQKSSPIALLASAGLDTIAVRVPAHPVAQSLLAAFGRPLAAPSANRSGRLSPTMARHVAEELGNRVAMIVDGGACPLGIESTILDLTGAAPILLRPGAITEEELSALVGRVKPARSGEEPLAPGMLESHYAPDHPLRLDAKHASSEEILIGFGARVPTGAGRTLNLSPAGDLTEAAANLFAFLRQADAAEFSRIAVMPVPEIGLGRAINDRLRRAAAARG